MKHVNYKFYQKTNTVIIIEAKFYKQNRVHFLFLLQKHGFSIIWRVCLDGQRRVLLLSLELNSPCIFFVQHNAVLSWSLHQ